MAKRRSPEIEEYLETLVRYCEEGRKPKVKDLARDLDISAASVSQMLKKLSERGLVEYERYGEIKLTDKGRELGKDVLRKHRLIEKFLVLIGVKSDRIHDEACALEHAVSDDVEKALRRAMRRGEPELKSESIRRLSEMRRDEKGTILLISGGRSACRRLTDMGLTPGTRITIGRASSTVG